MKERIIFLDIDGVLNYSAYFHSKKYLSERNPICKRNLFWVGLLCRLFKAKVVLPPLGDLLGTNTARLIVTRKWIKASEAKASISFQ